ncbi:MAG: uracil-DNA glycosylase [Gammaproteobacteria bacterium]|nr:uracil-DNA glycosylase [Gammaproteobacteria bacterium]
MGIQRWQLRNVEPQIVEEAEPVAEVVESVIEASAPAVKRADVVSPVETNNDSEWWSLSDEVVACRQCELHQNRTQTVFGVGNQRADWLIIGEAPGADEDREGEPFVGRAGKLLTQMILALGYEREDVYIANILKCRPPNNRDPLPDEVRSCESYLKRQIALIQPKIIVAVGRVAAQNLLKTDAKIGEMRGRTYHYGESETPVVVTYHPAYLLRSPGEKAKSWQDLRMAKRVFLEA